MTGRKKITLDLSSAADKRIYNFCCLDFYKKSKKKHIMRTFFWLDCLTTAIFCVNMKYKMGDWGSMEVFYDEQNDFDYLLQRRRR